MNLLLHSWLFFFEKQYCIFCYQLSRLATRILACECFTAQFSPKLHKYNVTICCQAMSTSFGFTFESLVEHVCWNLIHGLLSFCSHARGRLVFLSGFFFYPLAQYSEISGKALFILLSRDPPMCYSNFHKLFQVVQSIFSSVKLYVTVIANLQYAGVQHQISSFLTMSTCFAFWMFKSGNMSFGQSLLMTQQLGSHLKSSQSCKLLPCIVAFEIRGELKRFQGAILFKDGHSGCLGQSLSDLLSHAE